VWRLAVGWVGVYALVCQLLVGSIAGVRHDIAHAAAADSAGLELCRHDNGDAPNGQLPADSEDCCFQCLLNDVVLLGPAVPSSQAVDYAALRSDEAVYVASHNRGLPPRILYFIERHRGPPPAA